MASLMVVNPPPLAKDDTKNWLICTPEVLSATGLDITDHRDMFHNSSTEEPLE